jgi:hypothetical protein
MRIRGFQISQLARHVISDRRTDHTIYVENDRAPWSNSISREREPADRKAQQRGNPPRPGLG